MDSEIQISIIIPTYNSELTIKDTLDSIVREGTNLSSPIFEVLVVDDGSSDASIQIAHSYSNTLNLKVIASSHSGSPAIPRNLGIDNATGDYLFFLDSDDVLLPGGLVSAFKLAKENNSDVVVCRLKSLDGRGAPRGMHVSNEASVELTQSRIYWSLNPMKLFRRSLILKNNIRFAEGFGRDEDQPFVFKSYLEAKIISVLSDPPTVGIRYNQSGTNLTMRPYPIKDLIQYLETMTELQKTLPNIKDRNFLSLRHWEIEISREMIWKRLHRNSESEQNELFTYLLNFAQGHLEPNPYFSLSIRWRSIVRILNTGNFPAYKSLIRYRKQAVDGVNAWIRFKGVIGSNALRVRFTFVD